MVPRNPEELKAAVDSMFRIRAVESPPDAGGNRRIWHRGTRGAELVTEVDAQGRVKAQEFTLFEEHVRWERETGVIAVVEAQAAGTPVAPAGPKLTFDAPDATERVSRAARALEGYGGHDRFLLHLRDHLAAEARGSTTPEDPATRATPIMLPRQPPRAPTLPLPLLIALGLLLASLGVVLLFWK